MFNVLYFYNSLVKQLEVYFIINYFYGAYLFQLTVILVRDILIPLTNGIHVTSIDLIFQSKMELIK